jgi:hypothetical protein
MTFASGRGSNAAQLAKEWRECISKIARNLTDFNDSEACVRVKGRMSDAGSAYQGRTADAAREAVGALDALWQDYLLLSRVVDEADALVQKSGIFSNHDDEVVAMLSGPSIKLPVVSIPVQQRGLLDSPEHQGRVEPQAVLNSMIKAFDVARSTIAAIDQAEGALNARTIALRAALKEVADWSAANGVALGEANAPSIETIQRDPLSAASDLDAAEAAVAALKAKRDEAKRELAALDKGLADAAAELDALRAATAQAKSAIDDCGKRFEGAALVLEAEIERAAGELETWLETLHATRAAGRAKAGLIGLGKWEEFRLAKVRAAETVVDRARQLAAAHDDLAGRLRALRAKGQALAASRPPSPDLLALETEAKTEVRRTPCRMAQAEAAVKAYEDAVAAVARGA